MFPVPNTFEMECETLYITQLKFEIEISGRGVYMLNLRRQRVQRPHELANFKFRVEVLTVVGNCNSRSCEFTVLSVPNIFELELKPCTLLS